MKNPPSGDQGLAFQTHALQMTLFGPFYVWPQTVTVRYEIVSLQKKFQVIYGPGPSTRGESKGPSREGLWPKPDKIKHKIALGYSRGQFSPWQTQSSPPERRVKTVQDWNLEERSKIFRESCFYCHSMLWTWQEPPSLAFTNLPNNFEYRLMGQV